MPDRLIVVGAGSAGCVIAARAARSGREVTLIEAGPDYRPGDLPADLADGRHNSTKAHDWGFHHRPTTRQRIDFPLPRGRVVGGSSAVNTCIALRPQPYDHAEWVEATGDPTWSWDVCLPHYRRLEHDLDFPDHPQHGGDGPLPIRRHPEHEWMAWQAAFVEAAKARGFAPCDDQNIAGARGVGAHAMNKIDGRRISAAEAWLTPEIRRLENFTLHADTVALRVLFDGNRATALEIVHNDEHRIIEGGDIVLCAGAIQTPALLMRSGIGPRERVESLGVDLLSHNPWVSKRLLDHPGVALFFLKRFGGPQTTADPLIQTVARYGSEVHGGTYANDIQLQPGSKIVLPAKHLRGGSIMSPIGKPFGAGTLEITSAKVGKGIRIDSRLLEDARDRAMAVEALQKAYEISEHPAMKKLARPLWPRPRVTKDREKLDAMVRKLSDSGYHPCGTVPMSARPQEGACDSRGRIWGVDGLVVADASIMPTIPSSNIHLAVLMIGERFGEWLSTKPSAAPHVAPRKSS